MLLSIHVEQTMRWYMKNQGRFSFQKVAILLRQAPKNMVLAEMNGVQWSLNLLAFGFSVKVRGRHPRQQVLWGTFFQSKKHNLGTLVESVLQLIIFI